MERAIDRLPVETWRLIFQYACITPFWPFIDEDHNQLSPSITENYELFRLSYRPLQLYWAVGETRSSLRLVCRAWNAILDTFPMPYMYTDLSTCTFPTFDPNEQLVPEVVHLVGRHLHHCCFCSIHQGSHDGKCASLQKILLSQKENPWGIKGADMGIPLYNVKIVFLRDESFYSERFLKAATNIRALYWDGPTHNPVLFSSFNTTHLTHLALRQVRCILFIETYLKGSVLLPSVQYLELFLRREYSYHEGISSRDLRNTSPFPQLKSLKIGGDIDTHMQEAVKDFLMNCGQTVSEFVEYTVWYSQRTIPKILPTLSTYFPNLHLYGTLFMEFFSLTWMNNDELLYTPKGSSFTLFFYDFISGFRNESHTAVILLPIICEQWKVTRIMMDNSWTDMELYLIKLDELSRKSLLNSLTKLSSILGESVEFTDRDGFPAYRAKFQSEHSWLTAIQEIFPRERRI
jgi:hypothetical protein